MIQYKPPHESLGVLLHVELRQDTEWEAYHIKILEITVQSVGKNEPYTFVQKHQIIRGVLTNDNKFIRFFKHHLQGAQERTSFE